MGIEDIQISEELTTSAPSIKYSGDEGPKSPQEEMMMVDAVLEEEYEKYVFDLLEQRPDAQPMSMEEFKRMVIGDMSGGQPLPQDPTKPVNPFGPKPTGPVLPNRQMAAYGGIMGMDGRRQYGIGSSFKKFVRKIIPNEVAKVAEVAAPFVAPFNPIAAGLMSGIGGFDRTGSIGSSLKSGLMNYGLGQGARYLGGADLQKGMSLKMPGGSYFSKPTGTNKRFFDDIFKSKTTPGTTEVKDVIATGNEADEVLNLGKIKQEGTGGIMETIKGLIPESKLGKIALSGGAIALGTALLGAGPDETVSEIMNRGEGLDLDSIRTEVQEAFKDQTGEKLLALRTKYPYLGRADTKDIENMAMGGRTRRAEGGLMDLGGMEKDYRAEGGFVPIGAKEKADDVPARLSVNEFVFTADAVRNAGGGDIDRGAEIMENMMKNLEAGGQVSEESQGMQGAQQMFETSERLSEVM